MTEPCRHKHKAERRLAELRNCQRALRERNQAVATLQAQIERMRVKDEKWHSPSNVRALQQENEELRARAQQAEANERTAIADWLRDVPADYLDDEYCYYLIAERVAAAIETGEYRYP